jgi:hypothetical protein
LGHNVAKLLSTLTNALGHNADLSEMVRYFENQAGVEVRGRRDETQPTSYLNTAQRGKNQ